MKTISNTMSAIIAGLIVAGAIALSVAIWQFHGHRSVEEKPAPAAPARARPEVMQPRSNLAEDEGRLAAQINIATTNIPFGEADVDRSSATRLVADLLKRDLIRPGIATAFAEHKGDYFVSGGLLHSRLADEAEAKAKQAALQKLGAN